MKKGQEGFTLYELIVVIIMILFILVLIPVSIWATGSLITSGIKAGTDNCGQRYAIESIVSGDWFCPEEKK